MKNPTNLFKHKASGKIHKLLEVYFDKEEGEKRVVTLQVNFVSEPTATTESWLGDMGSFQKEFENA